MKAKKQISLLALSLVTAALLHPACSDSGGERASAGTDTSASSVQSPDSPAETTPEGETGEVEQSVPAAPGPGFDTVEWTFPPQEIEGVRQRIVGQGAEAVVILTPDNRRAPREVAVYLHHWSPLPPSVEAEAIQQLIKAGNTVLYPVYQEQETPVESYLPNAVAGIRAAISDLGFEPRGFVTVGQSTGGALAFDLAAVAGNENLPTPVAAVAVTPGREPQGVMPRPDYAEIAPATWLMAVQIPNSRIPGSDREGRRMLQLAGNVPSGQKRLYRARGVNARRGKTQMQISREFWHPILDFIAATRSKEAGG